MDKPFYGNKPRLCRGVTLCTQVGGKNPPASNFGNPPSPPLSEDEFWKIIFNHKKQLIAQILKENSDLCYADGEEVFSMLCDRYQGIKYLKMGYPSYKKLLQRMRWCKEDYRRKWKLDKRTIAEPTIMELIIRKERGVHQDIRPSDKDGLDLLIDTVMPQLGARHQAILSAAMRSPEGGLKRSSIYDSMTNQERSLFLPRWGQLVIDEAEHIKKSIASRTAELGQKIRKIVGQRLDEDLF